MWISILFQNQMIQFNSTALSAEEAEDVRL
jgi:hypothetical protein